MRNNTRLENEYHLAYPTMYLPCGGVANFDCSSGISYRCEVCNAVIGSVGQPRSCKDDDQFWRGWKDLGGMGWDYMRGEPKK